MKTVQIAPQIVFANGKRMSATQFNVVSVSDNLFDHVIFKYTLFDEHMTWAGESTYELDSLHLYKTWDASAEGAYIIVAQAQGFELVGKEAFFEG